VDEISLIAFSDELTKIAGLRDVWQNFLDLFRGPGDKAQRRVEYHFSPKAGTDRWRKFVRNVRDPSFIDQLAKHPDSDPKLLQHAKAMHELSRGTPVDKIQSARLPGRSYEIRGTASALACTCPDWRFKGSVNPGYECKHILAHRQGQVRAPN
jgi:hypothetical protein